VPAIVAAACSDASVNPVFHAASSPKWSQLSDETEFRRFRIDHIASTVPAFPASSFGGRGVVMAVGVNSDVSSAYASILKLRATGNLMPVEVFHNGAISETSKAEFEELAGVSVRVLSESDEVTMVPSAVVESSFVDVLYLSPRTFAIENPAALFESEEFTSTGLVMWPSLYKTSPSNPIWSMLGAACVDAHEQTAAAILLNKEQAWSALHMATHLRGSFYQSMVNGDDSVLHFGALATSTKAAFAPASQAVGTHYTIAGSRQFCAHSMVLSSLSGSPMFLASANSEIATSASKADSLTCLQNVEAVAHNDDLINSIVRLQAAVPEHSARVALQACALPQITKATYESYVRQGGDNYIWTTAVPLNIGAEDSVRPISQALVYHSSCGSFFWCADYQSRSADVRIFFFNLTSIGRSANVKIWTPTISSYGVNRWGNYTMLRVMDNVEQRDECTSGGGVFDTVSTKYHNIVNNGYAIVAVAWQAEHDSILPIQVNIKYNGPSSGAMSSAVASLPVVLFAIVAALFTL